MELTVKGDLGAIVITGIDQMLKYQWREETRVFQTVDFSRHLLSKCVIGDCHQNSSG